MFEASTVFMIFIHFTNTSRSVIYRFYVGFKECNYFTFFRRRGVQVSCSKKHCHSKDLNHRQCQRLSITLPTDNSVSGFWLWFEGAELFCSDEALFWQERISEETSDCCMELTSGGCNVKFYFLSINLIYQHTIFC